VSQTVFREIEPVRICCRRHGRILTRVDDQQYGFFGPDIDAFKVSKRRQFHRNDDGDSDTVVIPSEQLADFIEASELPDGTREEGVADASLVWDKGLAI
jgi:hypothetical protein